MVCYGSGVVTCILAYDLIECRFFVFFFFTRVFRGGTSENGFREWHNRGTHAHEPQTQLAQDSGIHTFLMLLIILKNCNFLMRIHYKAWRVKIRLCNPRKLLRVYYSIRGFESHLGLRFFLCPLMVDSLHLPLFPLNINISGIGWLVGGSFMSETFLTINVTVWYS